MRTVLKHRALGIAFVGMMLLAIWAVNAIFTQKFTSYDTVALKTDTAGLQLPSRADVKVRGEIVGEVTKMASGPGGAVLTLGLDPGKIGSIPANVTAAILPKTLFGEKYVSLVIPSAPDSSALRAGDTIKQTALPIEVEKVLNDIYPLLRAVQPAEINYTLNALATALEGRGDKIGNNLEVLNSYLQRMNPQLPNLISDLKLLGTVSDNYATVFPDIAATLRNTVKTTGTLKEKAKTLNAFLKDTASFSDTAKGFLDANGDNIVQLGQLSEKQLAVLARYSPEFPCLLGGLVNQAPKLAQTFRGFVFHIKLRTIPKQPRAFTAADQPVNGDGRAPYCGTLPTPPYSPSNPKHHMPDFNDGVENGNQLKRVAPAVDRPSVTGTPADKALIVSLTAPILGVPADQVGDITTLLFAPLAHGSEVSVQ
jgi:phospholipid/cholesterol/gamma-HCH transport system substrate-binding protein